MNILDTIVAQKLKEVASKRELVPIDQFESSELFQRETFSMSKSLISSKSGIIAEHKRRSPSKSVINQSVYITDVAKGYESAGAAAMSVLTDGAFFGGSLDDLLFARSNCDLPILRKEFIIDPYQIYEAKAYGADAILLIAAILLETEIEKFSKIAHNLGMEVLLEVHNADELNKASLESIDMLGVNNRNLKTFEVDLNTSKILSELIPGNLVKVSESGISSIEAIQDLKKYGYQGFLIGENFMKTKNPGKAAAEFIKTLET